MEPLWKNLKLNFPKKKCFEYFFFFKKKNQKNDSFSKILVMEHHAKNYFFIKIKDCLKIITFLSKIFLGQILDLLQWPYFAIEKNYFI